MVITINLKENLNNDKTLSFMQLTVMKLWLTRTVIFIIYNYNFKIFYSLWPKGGPICLYINLLTQ